MSGTNSLCSWCGFSHFKVVLQPLHDIKFVDLVLMDKDRSSQMQSSVGRRTKIMFYDYGTTRITTIDSNQVFGSSQ